MNKLFLVPKLATYANKPGKEVEQVALDGGPSRTRAAIANAPSLVNVSFEVSDQGKEYFWAFYNTTIKRGIEAFLLDLSIDKAPLREHTVQIVAESVDEKPVDDGLWEISAQLEATRIADDADFNAGLVALVEGFGVDGVAEGLDLLAALVNTDLPAVDGQ